MSAPGEKHPRFIVRQRSPLNGGPPLPLLVDRRRTPLDLFFVRNHAPPPDIDPDRFRLCVSTPDRPPVEFDLRELKTAFPRREVEATLQCAGNRRDELIAVREIPGEVPWGAEAIGNAVWGGASLIDVLRAADVASTGRHVAFLGADAVEKNGGEGFGGSIPLARASEPDVLLAYDMNGAPLPRDHGYPLRAVVPGYIGARSVKWLIDVRVQDAPSENYFQQRSYKLFPTTTRADTADWSAGEMLGELGPTGVLCDVEEGSGDVTVLRGYAMGTAGAPVSAVEVSIDEGATWEQAQIDHRQRGAWSLWSHRLRLPGGEHDVIVRVSDETGITQPTRPNDVWNFKGYLNTARHRTTIRVD